MQIYFTNNMVEATGIKDEWERVEKVIRAHMTNKDPEFQELALCIGKYDYYDAPTNWELEYKHEVVLEKWTQWAIQHREEYYDALITKMLQDYREGKIPYGGDLMFGYFAWVNIGWKNQPFFAELLYAYKYIFHICLA